jgi:uncharacterized oligopeptide transporter (OPT) family protein
MVAITVIVATAVIPRTIARAVIPTVAVGVPVFLPVAIRMSITVATVFDLLDVGRVHMYCVRHHDRRGV